VSHDVDLLELETFLAGTADSVFDQLREEDPLHWNDEPDGRGFWSLTRYDDVLEVASDATRFINAKGTQIPDRKAEGEGLASLHNSDAPRHLELRRILAPHLRPKQVSPMSVRIGAVVDELLDRVEAAPDFDLVKEISAQLPILVFGSLLGVPVEDCPLLVEWTNASSSLDPEYAPSPDVAAKAREELFAYFHELQDARRTDPQDDLVSALATAELDGAPLTRAELDPYCLLLTVAGNETTRNLITGGLQLLSQHPEVWDALTGAPDHIPAAIEEMVRMVSPVMHMRRTAAAEVEMHGKTIQPDDKVVLWFVAGNRDPRVFDRPHVFVPGRSPNDHLGFGWGPHSCMGAHLARLEVRVLLERLAARGLRVVTSGEPDRLASNWFRGIKHLSARVDRHAVGVT
jgi:cholest-4-en-3-one 26-monooxygenase